MATCKMKLPQSDLHTRITTRVNMIIQHAIIDKKLSDVEERTISSVCYDASMGWGLKHEDEVDANRVIEAVRAVQKRGR